MSAYIGDFVEDATVNFMIFTSATDGSATAPSTALEAADLIIYKDNSATQKTSTNGVTMTSPFDSGSLTGAHQVNIDTSNDTGDAGFWAVGSDYFVVLAPDETVDSITVERLVAHFSIENRIFGQPAGATLAADLATIDGNVDSILTDTADMQPKLGTPAGADMSADIAAVKSDSAAILTDTGTTIPGVLGTPAGADMSADIAAVKTDTAAILVDTGTDGVAIAAGAIDTGQFAAGAIDAAAIATDAIGAAEVADALYGSIKKNATFSNFMFTMRDSTNHVPTAGLTVSGERSLDAAAFAAVSGTITEISDGVYQFDAVAADTNGDFVTWKFTASGADQVTVHFKTVS